MNKTILYIYGYGSNHKDSSTMKVVKKVVEDLGYDLVSIEYNQIEPNKGIDDLEKYINDNDIKYVIGHSLGGFITMCLGNNVKKLVINPCLHPSDTLPKIDFIPVKTLNEFTRLEKFLFTNNSILSIDDMMGLFGDKDELFSFYDEFKKIFPKSYKFNSTHRPTLESFTKDIKEKIEKYFD